jgi:hypothetical protein
MILGKRSPSKPIVTFGVASRQYAWVPELKSGVAFHVDTRGRGADTKALPFRMEFA